MANSQTKNPAKTAEWPHSQVQPFLDYLTIECGLAENTIAAYRRDLRGFCGFCLENKIKDPADISPLLVQNYARELSQKKLATASIARNLVTLKMFIRFHVLSGILKEDMCSLLESPKTWRHLPRILAKQRTVELITAIDPAGPYAIRDRAIMEMLYATGMRASEMATLKLEDVNFQIGYIRCFGKGSKERIIPIHQKAVELLKEYLEGLRPKLVGQKDSSAVFLSRTGRALGRIEIWRIVRRAAMTAGMAGKISPHTLRHCFGSHLLQGGAGLRIVQEMLGHADVTTTQIYTHIDHEHLRNVHKKYHPRP